MSYSPVHFPFDGIGISQRRSAGAEFDQKCGRRSPVSNSDALNEEVGTAFERVFLDHSGNETKSKRRDQRIGSYLIGDGQKVCKTGQRGEEEEGARTLRRTGDQWNS